MNWYALKSRDELFTLDMLHEANFLAYVPCEIVERKIKRAKTFVRRPLCPGYVFVRCSPEAFTAVRAIGAGDDFVRFTDPAGTRVPLRLAPNALMAVVLAEVFGEFDHSRVPPVWLPERGDQVRVKAGMWKGYIGTITSVGKPGKKALIETQWCTMEVMPADLELAA